MGEMKLPSFDELRQSGHVPRVHGNGFVQLDLNDDGTERLHVWDLDVPRQEVATPIHDHVFRLRSEVLCGTLIHEELDYYPDDNGTHEVYRARREKGTQNTTLQPENYRVSLITNQRLVLGRGSIYTFPAFKLHQTDHVGLTATLMEKNAAPKDYGTPMVLVEIGQQPDNDFHRDSFDLEMLWEIIGRIYGQA